MSNISSSENSIDFNVYFSREIKLKIFNFLDFRTILQISSVCKEWRTLCNEEELWKGLYSRAFGPVKPFISSPASYSKSQCKWKNDFLSTLLGYPGYGWDIGLEERSEDCYLEVKFTVPRQVKGSQLDVKFTRNTITAGLKGQTTIIEGRLHANIIPNESLWQKDDDKVTIHLVPVNIEHFLPNIERPTQPHLIVGPRLENDPSTIDLLSRQLLSYNMPPLPFINPFDPVRPAEAQSKSKSSANKLQQPTESEAQPLLNTNRKLGKKTNEPISMENHRPSSKEGSKREQQVNGEQSFSASKGKSVHTKRSTKNTNDNNNSNNNHSDDRAKWNRNNSGKQGNGQTTIASNSFDDHDHDRQQTNFWSNAGLLCAAVALLGVFFVHKHLSS